MPVVLTIRTGSGDGIHLRRDAVEQRLSISPYCIQIEMRAIGQVGEVRICVQPFQHCFELAGGTIQVEGISGSYKEMNPAALTNVSACSIFLRPDERDRSDRANMPLPADSPRRFRD